MITFTQFKYFLVVAEEKSFTKAAKKLYISQQALSNHILSMEKDLQVTLFERTSPLKLTDPGIVFHRYATHFTLTQSNMYQELEDITKKQIGTFHFGLSINRGAMILPRLLPILKEEFPNVEFIFVEANCKALKKQLLNGTLDLILEQLPFEEEQITSVPICKDEICMLVSQGFLKKRFGNDAESVKGLLYETGRISALNNCPFLLNKSGNSIRSRIDAILSLEGMEPESKIETENLNTLLNLCANDYGITFYPKLFLQPPHGAKIPDNVIVIPLRYSSTNYTLGIGYKNGYYLSDISKRIIELVKEFCSF